MTNANACQIGELRFTAGNEHYTRFMVHLLSIEHRLLIESAVLKIKRLRQGVATD